MKNLFVPYLKELNNISDNSIINSILEKEATKDLINIVNWKDYPFLPKVSFQIARSNSKLFIKYSLETPSVKAIYKCDDSPVHLDSCVEFFMKLSNSSEYMNFEFNCIGACDVARRKSRQIKTSITKEEYISIQRYSTFPFETFPEKEGNFFWQLLVIIPLEIMGLDGENLPDKIEGNFYVCGDETFQPYFVSWSPINTSVPDFHRPEFFGEIHFIKSL